ncbi:hypothetical protein STRNTR1_2298 [Stenotrophomonas maltophilia]|nr:hypothetical protein STRNTR1_2298 [Stenotrophomonas maltophilia]
MVVQRVGPYQCEWWLAPCDATWRKAHLDMLRGAAGLPQTLIKARMPPRCAGRSSSARS